MKPEDFQVKEPKMHYGRKTADGICFDEVGVMKRETRDMLVGRNVVWLTRFSVYGSQLRGSVIAPNGWTAAAIVDSRGLGEVVTGRCVDSSIFN